LAKAYEIKVWCYWEHFGEHIEDLIGTFGNLIEKEKKSLPQKFVQIFPKESYNNSFFFPCHQVAKFCPKKKHTHTHTHTNTHIDPNVTKLFFSEIRGFFNQKNGNISTKHSPFKILVVLILAKFHIKKKTKTTQYTLYFPTPHVAQ
jgi:hypothetical protein